MLPQFFNYLHTYLQQKYIGEIYAEPDSPISLIKEKARKIINDFENKIKKDLINKLIDEFNPNGWGILGIEAVVNALLLEQIKTLIYDINFKMDGYICDSCNYISIKAKDSCPYCGGKLVYYNDIVDEIVEDALEQGCEVIDVYGNERLIQAGSIGAVLRYKL